MIIVMKIGSSKKDIQEVANIVTSHNFTPHIINGVTKTVIGVVGDGDKSRINSLKTLISVESVFPVSKPYKLAARTSKEENTVISINGIEIGNSSFSVIAGPCSVESEKQILDSANQVHHCGAHMLRGGAYKPRTSPYSFQGMELFF